MYKKYKYSVGSPRTVGVNLDNIITSAAQSAFGIAEGQSDPQQAINQGVASIATLLQGDIKDGWQGAQLALSAAKAIPDPTVQAIAHIGSFVTTILYEMVGDKPCEFMQQPDCKISSPDGHPILNYAGDCCLPRLTGRGVLLSMQEPGATKYPGRIASEAPAWDYPYLSCTTANRNKSKILNVIPNQDIPSAVMVPCVDIGDNAISGALIPANWQVRMFSNSDFGGNSIVLGDGAHPLISGPNKFSNTASSIQIRGPWTLQDAYIAQHLRNRDKGWVTQYMTTPPNWETLIQLVTLDPTRPLPPTDFSVSPQPYLSVWRPGWFFRLLNAGVLATPTIQSMLKLVGIGERELQIEAVANLKDNIEVLTLVEETMKLGPQKGKVLLERIFKTEPILGEIAIAMVKLGMHPNIVSEMKLRMMDRLKAAQRQFNVSGYYRYY
jgi:hypothetical protein